MSIESGLKSYLGGKADLTSQIGTRLFPLFAPQTTTTPFVVYAVVSEPHDHTLTAGAGRATPRIQVSVYDEHLADCRVISEIIRAHMQGYSGAMGSETVSAVMLENEVTLYDPPQAGESSGLYHVEQDYFVMYEVSVPTF